LDKPLSKDKHPPIRPDVLKAIEETSLYELIVPPFQRTGSNNLQVYYVGPEDAPYLRIAPWAPAAKEADKKYPEHNQNHFWSFFFPTLVESWMQWVGGAFGPDGRPTQVTILPPYEDAGGGGLVTTFFHPLWSADRTTFAGAVGIDLTLDQIIDYIKDQRLYDSGFAFLAQSSGNVLAINEAGERLLGLHQETDKGGSGGVDVLNRNLAGSKHPDIAALTLPNNDEVSYREFSIGRERYVLVLRRLPPFETWAGKLGISPEHWTLGLVVPASEIYASLVKARASISKSTNNIVVSQSIITLITLLLVLLGISFVSWRMTAALDELSHAARVLMAKDYDVEVKIRSEDEIGELGLAFNAMASEIRAHTRNLEGLVRQRTRQLEQANREILLLNERLKEENLRMGAELDVARRLQLMVLPNEQELSAIKGLDIAGYMEPADEVGGDYYDVLSGMGALKIGIGDVTGHGLESGVLMIMLQAAVRTLVLAEENDPERFMSIVNKVVYQNIRRTDMDRSMTLSLIDYQDGVLSLVGQHEDAIVVRADGQLERIDTMPLGLPVGLEFDISDFLNRLEVPLNPGDVMVLYTDGITEAEAPDGEQYGFDRLCKVAVAHHQSKACKLKDAIVQDVGLFISDQKVFDDITVVVIKRDDEVGA
ncbi:SpoIIE family protein phosphatase, partial [Myxococcota bacterium]|nr:SpoIIE family protein phosphatase [Myxococcota bacterium]MBU1897538.1 SpoIIE family protein phosphatase [Myxococcota bacterium]